MALISPLLSLLDAWRFVVVHPRMKMMLRKVPPHEFVWCRLSLPPTTLYVSILRYSTKWNCKRGSFVGDHQPHFWSLLCVCFSKQPRKWFAACRHAPSESSRVFESRFVGFYVAHCCQRSKDRTGSRRRPTWWRLPLFLTSSFSCPSLLNPSSTNNERHLVNSWDDDR